MSSPSAIYTAGECLPARGTGQKLAIRPTANLAILKGQLLVAETNSSASDVQSLATAGGPTSGSFQLSFNGQLTGPIAFNGTVTQVQTALSGLANIGPGNLACAGGPLGTAAIVITFAGELASLPQPLINVVNSTLSGGTSPTATLSRTTAGVGYGRFRIYAGAGMPVISQYDFRSDERGRVIKGQALLPQFSLDPDTSSWIGGVFRNGDLIGLDATAVTNMGARWFTGSLSDANALLIVPGAQ